MVDKGEFEGNDLEEALRSAAEGTGIAEAELHYEIVEQGRKGVFGLGAKSVRIRVIPPLDGEPAGSRADPGAAPETGAGEDGRDAKPRRRRRRDGRRASREAAPGEARERPAAAPVSPEDAERVVETVRRIVELAGLELEVEQQSLEGAVTLKLDGPDRKALTSKNAELLAALQFVLNRMSRRAWPGVHRVQLTCDGAGRQRDDDLVELAREVAQQVARTGRTKKLQPMNAYERRLVHLTIREFGGLSSSSDGRGSLKRVRISKIQNSLDTP